MDLEYFCSLYSAKPADLNLTTSQRELLLEGRSRASAVAWEDLCKYITTMVIVILNPYFITHGVVTPSCIKADAPTTAGMELPNQWNQFLHSREKAIKYKTWKHLICFRRFHQKCHQIGFPFISFHAMWYHLHVESKMNLCAKQKLTQGHRDQTVVAKREEEGSGGSLGLVDANYYIWNE